MIAAKNQVINEKNQQRRKINKSQKADQNS